MAYSANPYTNIPSSFDQCKLRAFGFGKSCSKS